jgi:hypothetical protein
MVSDARPRILETGALALLCAAGVLVAGVLEHRSVERANRLHRDGELAEAARAYGDRAGGNGNPLDLRYNFGTTLLGLGSAAAPSQLSLATASEDDRVRGRAFYNLGLWHLHRARDVAAADSVRAHARASADANKEVLRLEPGQPDARWNLALAQRLLDSINADDGRAGTETVDGSNDADEQVLSEELREFEDPSDVDQAPQQGSDEALAQADDTDRLTPLEAEAILVADPDRSVIVRKLLVYQGRTQRRPFSPPSQTRARPRW